MGINHSENTTRRVGTYCWVTASSVPNTSVFFPVPKEDYGKNEKTRIDPCLSVLTPNHLGIISGAVKPDECPTDAVYREALEEQKLYLPPDSVSNSLPKVTVIRSKNGKASEFDAIGHTTTLSQEQITQLQMFTPLIFVADEALDRFLIENRSILRPHVHLVGWLLLKNRRLSHL